MYVLALGVMYKKVNDLHTLRSQTGEGCGGIGRMGGFAFRFGFCCEACLAAIRFFVFVFVCSVTPGAFQAYLFMQVQ